MNISIIGTSFHVLELPLLLFLIVFIAKDSLEDGLKVNFRKSDWQLVFLIGFVLFLCSILLSAVQAYSSSLVYKSFFKWSEIALTILLIFVYSKNKYRFVLLYKWFAASCMLSLCVVFFNIASSEFSLFSYRIFPSYESAIVFSLVLPIVSKRHLVFTLGIVLVSFFGAVLSLSRAAWLAVSLVTGYSFLYFHAKIKKVATLSIFVVLIFGFLTPQIRLLVGYKVNSFFQEENLSNNVRTNLLKRALEAFSEHPLNGIGAENFPEYIIQEGLLSGLFSRNYSTLTPHNYFLQILAEQGLLGFLSFSILIIALIMMLFKTNRINPDQSMSKYILGLRLVFIVFFVNLMFGYIASQFRFYFAFLIGLSVATFRFYEGKKLPKEKASSIPNKSTMNETS